MEADAGTRQDTQALCALLKPLHGLPKSLHGLLKNMCGILQPLRRLDRYCAINKNVWVCYFSLYVGCVGTMLYFVDAMLVTKLSRGMPHPTCMMRCYCVGCHSLNLGYFSLYLGCN